MRKASINIAAAALLKSLAIGGFAVALGLFAGVDQSPASNTIGGNFTLVDGAGRTVTAQTFRGRYTLVFFGYTHCPDLCPTMLYTIAQSLPCIGNLASRLQPIFITIDPLRDSPAIIGRYVALFSPKIIGLSGTQAQLRAVEQEYHVYVGPADPKTGAITHSAILYLMGPEGQLVAALGDNLDAAQLTSQLTKLMKSD